VIFLTSCCVLQSDTFQEDLFPDTAAPTPAISARDWINGRNCNPVLMSMNTGKEILTQRSLQYLICSLTCQLVCVLCFITLRNLYWL
jgi:hypothetical protein